MNEVKIDFYIDSLKIDHGLFKKSVNRYKTHFVTQTKILILINKSFVNTDLSCFHHKYTTPVQINFQYKKQEPSSLSLVRDMY